MVICLERGADLHTAQLMPLPLTVSCSSKIQIGFTFLVLAHPGRRGQRAVKRVCVCVYVGVCRERAERDESRGSAGMARRGRGVGRGGHFMPGATDGGFDRFGKREFERRSGSDKTYARSLPSSF